MQRLLTPGITCRLRGVDQSGFQILKELRQHHLKRVIFIPALLKLWNEKLKSLDVEVPDQTLQISHEGKELLRKALGIYARRKLMEQLEPVTVRELPKKQKLFTVLKGPHIDKKAREQFFFTTYGVELFMKTNAVSSMMLTETLARLYETGMNELNITARF